MAWRDDLREASFRGVSFQVAPGEAPIGRGRRLHPHEYPGRDEPYVEDLGRRGRVYTMTAYVIGDDWLGQAKKLVAACDGKAEPGKLVHPWLGELTVCCQDCTEVYDAGRGTEVGFRLTFLETARPKLPSATKNPIDGLDAKAALAKIATATDFATAFAASGLAGFVSEQAQSLLGGLAEDLGIDIGSIAAAGATSATWSRALTRLVGDVAQYIADPASLADQVLTLMDLGNVCGISSLVQTAYSTVESLFGDDEDEDEHVSASWTAYRDLAAWEPEATVPTTTPSRQQQAANQAAVVALVRQSAVIEAARAAVRTDYTSHEDAIAVRDELSDLIDQVQADAADDSYRALSRLYAELVHGLTQLAPSLPRLITVTPTVTLPAVVVAYQRFGDNPELAVDRADDLVARNGIPHPLFCPAQPLPVLGEDAA